MKMHLVTVEESWTETDPETGIAVTIPKGIALAGVIEGDYFHFQVQVSVLHTLHLKQDFSERRILPMLQGLTLR